MEYKQITQTSRPYEYGEGKEFKTKDEALKRAKELAQEIKVKLALQRLYDLSEVKTIEAENALQIVVTTRIPIIVEQTE